MKIPIANGIYENKIDIKSLLIKKSNFLRNINHLKFESVDKKRFPIVTLLSKKIYSNSGAIILNASNEVLVNEFLKKRIAFNSIYPCLKRVFRDKDFKKYAIKRLPNINEIYKIDNWARRKTLDVIKNKK
jgi:1-deoxy-D-xylulose 5-phosphate reductoisomerase